MSWESARNGARIKDAAVKRGRVVDLLFLPLKPRKVQAYLPSGPSSFSISPCQFLPFSFAFERYTQRLVTRPRNDDEALTATFAAGRTSAAARRVPVPLDAVAPAGHSLVRAVPHTVGGQRIFVGKMGGLFQEGGEDGWDPVAPETAS